MKSGDQIGNSDWLESTTYRIINYMLTHSDNVYEVTQLLKILDSESITLIFSKEGNSSVNLKKKIIQAYPLLAT